MKKSVITLAIIVNFTFATNILAAVETASNLKGTFKNQKEQRSELSMFRGLSLSEQQKQDIKALFKQVKQDNSIYRADVQLSLQEMQYVMEAPQWDQGAASQLISQHAVKMTQAKLNMAKTKHAAYQLLSSEQKALLEEKQANKLAKKEARANKGNKSDKAERESQKTARKLAKKLNLSPQQIQQWKTIQANAKAELAQLKDQAINYRQIERALIQASDFDEDAWLALHQQANVQQQAMRLVGLKAKYDRRAVLTDQQVAQYKKYSEKSKNKMKEKRRSSGSI